LQAVADKAGITLDILHDYFDDRLDLLAAFGRIVDKKTLASIGKPDEGLSARDRLFDILMGRFDVLNDSRDGLVAVIQALKFDPKTMILTMPHIARSMSWMLEAAGIPTTGWQGSLKIAGLTIVYIDTMRHWAKDETEDMADTMAALDRALGRAERWAGTVRLY
jgi:hypothetical protein